MEQGRSGAVFSRFKKKECRPRIVYPAFIQPGFILPRENWESFSKRTDGDHLIYLITEPRKKKTKCGVKVTEKWINISCSKKESRM